MTKRFDKNQIMSWALNLKSNGEAYILIDLPQLGVETSYEFCRKIGEKVVEQYQSITSNPYKVTWGYTLYPYSGRARINLRFYEGF